MAGFGEFTDVLNDVAADKAKAETGNPFTYQPPADAVPAEQSFAQPAAPSLNPDAGAPPNDFASFGEFGDTLKDVAKERDDRVTAALDMARESDPDRYAQAKAIGDRYGIPVDFTLENLPEMQKREGLMQMRGILEGNPGIKDWFAEQDNARLVKLDDLASVQGLTWALEAGGASYSAGWRQRELAAIRYNQIFGKASDADLKRAEELSSMPARDYGAGGFLDRSLTGAAGFLPGLIGGGEQAIYRGAQGGTVGGFAGAAWAGVGAIPGAVAGATAGASVGFGEDMAHQEAGLAFDNFLKIRDDAGRPVDPDVARGAAMLVGAANGILGVVPFASILKGLPGPQATLLKSVIGKLGSGSARDILLKPTYAAAFKQLGKTAFEETAVQSGIAGVQEAVRIIGEEGTKGLSEGDFDHISPGEAAGRVGHAVASNLEAMAAIAPFMGAPRLAGDLYRAYGAERNAAVFGAMQDSAKGFELRNRLPAKAKELVERATAGGPVENVYIPADKLATFFQEREVNPDDLDHQLPGFADRYNEALASGQDVAIPIRDYYTHVAGSELGAAMAEHSRFNPDDMTAAEARQFQETYSDHITRLLDEDMQRLQEAGQQASDLETEIARFKEQQIAAGVAPDIARAQADLYGHFFRSLGEHYANEPDAANNTAAALFRRMAPDVRRVLPQELTYQKQDHLDVLLDTLRGRGLDTVKQEQRSLLGQSLFDFIAGRGGMVDDGGELASRDLGKIRPGLVARAGEDGLIKSGRAKGNPAEKHGLDETTLAAWEAGYFPDHVDRPTPNDLLEAIDREAGGDPVYAGGDTADTVQLSEGNARLANLARTLEELGLDPHSMTNEEIRRELAAVTTDDPHTNAMFQFGGVEGGLRLAHAAGQSDAGGVPHTLNDAINMEDGGHAPEEIFHQTGWFRGVDGLWRFELADTDAKIRTGNLRNDFGLEKFKLTRRRTFADRLDLILDHPTLFQAYPQLAGLHTELTIGKGETGGVFYSDTGKIEARGETLAEARSVLLHEVAHAIQTIEDFARGGNSTMGELFEGETVQAWRDHLHELETRQQDLLDRVGFRGYAPDEETYANQLHAAIIEAQSKLQQAAAYEYYKRIAGEVEARNVQKREDLRQSGQEPGLPWKTEDVPQDQQTVHGQRIAIARTERHGDAFSALTPAEARQEFFQRASDTAPQNLLVQHNLTADNLVHADKMRGLAAPSVAVSRVEHPLDGFGEITLLGDRNLVDPKVDPKAKTFDADVYSPRYPTVRYKVAAKVHSRIWKSLEGISAELGHVLSSELDPGEVERNGLRAFEDSSAVKLAFLREKGAAPELPKEAARSDYLKLNPELKDLVSEWDMPGKLAADPKFLEAMGKAIDAEIAKIREIDPEFPEQALRDRYYLRDGSLRRSVIENVIQEKKVGETPKVDRYAARNAINKALEEHGAGFKEWVREKFSDVIAGEQIQVEGRNGDWKYLPHTLDNVVKAMSRKLQDGEGFDFGTGSLRSNVAKKFRSVAEMQKDRDRIIDHDRMQAIKDEVNDEFVSLAERLGAKAKHGSNDFGFMDRFSEHLKEVVDSGIKSLDRYYDGLNDEDRQAVADYLNKLRNLPTEYFESKLQRAVGLNEFKAAVIPHDTPKAARDALTYSRVPVHEYDPAVPGSRTEAIARAAAEHNILFQGKGDLAGPKDARGSIQFGGERPIINLFESANLSTFLHESGHFFLQMYRDLATREGAPASLVAEWEKIKEAFGIPDDGAIAREHHETFARSFEAYLFEGKAPSQEIAGIFARFTRWLTAVYASIKSLRVNMTDEVRGVFDRMLATREELDRQQQGQEFKTWFDEAKTVGMSDEEFRAYRALATMAADEATAELTAKMMRTVKAEETREWLSAKKEIREEVRKDLLQARVYQVTHYLQTGKLIDPELSGPEGLKLDREALVNEFGPGILAKLPRSVPPLFSKKGGVHPDLVAEIFGYTSGDELVQDLISAPPLSRAIVEETNLRLRDRFGDLMQNVNRRTEEANAALHNEGRAKVLEAEIKALSRKVGGQDGSTPRQFAKALAKQTLGAKTVMEATRVATFRAAERKAAKEAEKAIQAGDFGTALEWKRRQLFNHEFVREAERLVSEVQKLRNYLDRFTGRKVPKAVDPTYLEQIRGLLERFDFAKVSANGVADRQSLRTFLEEAEARGEVTAVPDALRDDAFRMSYKEMTVDDMRALSDAVKNLEHLGKLKKKLLVNKALRDFQAVKAELLASSAGLKTKRQVGRREPTTFEWLRDRTYGLAANLLKIEQLVDWLDGKDINGPWRKYLFEPMSRAQAKEFDLNTKYTGELHTIFEKFKGDYLTKKVFIPEINNSVTREQLFALALNVGNASNKDKLLRGEAMLPATEPRFDTEEKLAAGLKHLTKEEWDAVQKAWDLIEKLWPEIEAMQKRTAGIAPPKVERSEVVTDHGTYKGGYFPLVYDPAFAFDVQQREDAAADKMFENTYTRPATDKGFTKARVQGYTRPIALRLSVIGEHIAKVTHDLTHREAIRDALKLITDPEVQGEIERTFGRPVYSEVYRWLQRIANDREVKNGSNVWQPALTKIRTNIGLFQMGYRITTVVAQFVGFMDSLGFVSPKHLGGGLLEFMKNPIDNLTAAPGSATEWVFSNSGELRHREQTIDRDIRDAFRTMRDDGIVTQAKRAAFHGIGMADRLISIVTWIGAYNEHMEKNPGDEAGAIMNGDRAVRLGQGSGGAKDLAAIQSKGDFMKLTTMFYSYFSAYFNRMWDLGRDAGVAVSERNAAAIPSLVGRLFALSILPAVMGDMLVGRGPDDRKKETWAGWMARKIALYPLMGIPILRDMATALDGPTGHYDFTPVQRFFQGFVDIAKELEKGKQASPRVLTRKTVETAGTAAGLPLGQAVTTADSIWKGMEQHDFKVKDLFFGRGR